MSLKGLSGHRIYFKFSKCGIQDILALTRSLILSKLYSSLIGMCDMPVPFKS